MKRLTSCGKTLLTVVGICLWLSSHLAVAVDLFVADYGSNTIYKFTPSGSRSTFASGLNGPAGLAFDGNGNLFESDNGSGNIYKFTPDGSRTTFASGLNSPSGLAFAPTIPEPSTVSLLGIGAISLFACGLWRSWRKW